MNYIKKKKNIHTKQTILSINIDFLGMNTRTNIIKNNNNNNIDHKHNSEVSTDKIKTKK